MPVDHDAEYALDRAQDRFEDQLFGERRPAYTKGGPADQCPRCGLFAYGLPHDCEAVIADAMSAVREGVGDERR